MIVDMYTHFMPSEFAAAMERMATRYGLAKRMKEVLGVHDLDTRFRSMDGLGDYRQVIALPNPPIEAFTTANQCVELSHIANDAMAELARRHPDRFAAFVAAVPMLDIEAALEETSRAIDKLGARGVQVFTNVNGRPLDDPYYRPLFDKMAGYDLPVFLHPARSAQTTDYAAEAHSRYEMWWLFGWPYETSVAMTRLALAGLFDRHPALKIVTHHGGGMIPFFDTRIEKGLAVLGARTKDEDYSHILPSLKRPLMDYLHGYYADTALFGASRGIPCALDFFGSERIVFASDAPFGPVESARDAVAALDLDETRRDAIFRGNAEKLLRMQIH